MNPHDPVHLNPDTPAAAADADRTLRLVAGLPAPEGLEERVHAALRSAPRSGRVLSWPSRFVSDSPWRRSAAAAAIAFVVVGGGWGVYSRVQPNNVIAMPLHAPAQSGFSGANAVHPTLNGPVLQHPAPVVDPKAVGAKTAASHHVVEMTPRHEPPQTASPAK